MKTTLIKNQILTAFAALGLVASITIVKAASDIHFGPTGTEASISNPDGTWINMWGPAFTSTTFDAANPPPSGDTTGSVYNQGTWTADGQDDYNMISPGTWYGNVVFDGSQYTNLVFDFKYDTNSTIIPSSAAHIEMAFDGGYSEKLIETINTTTIDPATSTPYFDGNWHHVQIAIPSTISGVGSVDGVSYYQYNASARGTMNYWMANVVLYARVVPVAPPTINSPVKNNAAGLAVYASTEGNSFYDRQSVLFTTNTGTSWMSPGVTYPVSYSFTIADMPTSAASYGCEAWLFLSPNPAAIDNAPDWNETNMVISFLQMNTNGATLNFQYKVNEDHQAMMYGGGGPDTRSTATVTNNYYYTAAPGSLGGVAITNMTAPGVYDITNESGNLGSLLDTNGPIGTWTITFTSANDVTLTSPHGYTTNLVIPSYNAPLLAPGANGMNIFLGMQANNAASINQRVVYSNFAISGGAPTTFADNFAADTTLNTTAWATAQATGPKGILIIKPGWMFSWPLPDTGFSPQIGADLTNSINWIQPANSAPFSLLGEDAQIVWGSDLPAGNTAFYRLIKRTYSQLQVLLPGETNAPGTISGIIGTPAPLTNSVPFTVTVNACDSTWHIVNVSGDIISLTSSTAGNNFVPQSGTALANGSVQMNAEFLVSGSQTITATDSGNTNIPPVTTSPLTVN